MEGKIIKKVECPCCKVKGTLQTPLSIKEMDEMYLRYQHSDTKGYTLLILCGDCMGMYAYGETAPTNWGG